MQAEHIQAKYLKKAKNAGLNDKGLANLLGVSTRSIEAWRAGTTAMPKGAKIICSLLKTQPEEVMRVALEV